MMVSGGLDGGGAMEDSVVAPVNRGSLRRLLDKVRDDQGLELHQYRERYLERRVGIRLTALGLQTYHQYAAYLDSYSEEYAALVDTIAVNVTQFFRDDSFYERFRATVIPAVLEHKASRHQHIIRVWSAGCATGQEPYSIAMSFMSVFIERPYEYSLSVYGTDLDIRAIEVARRATYPLAQLEHIPYADRCFVEIGSDTFKIKPEVTRIAHFSCLNLHEEKPIQVLDVIFCRNVFIYFNKDEQKRMLESFWEALSPGGYLVLGRSERMHPSLNRRFELIDSRERIYRKPLSAF